MKMTLHIDEALLARVMERCGCATKTEAVDHALRETERRDRLRAYAAGGLGLSAAELREGVAPGYDILASRATGKSSEHGRRRTRR